MKKLLMLVALVLGLGAFFYYYYSAPRVIDRRLDSLLDTMTFGAVSLKENDKAADEFADHFAESVRFSGAGDGIIAGTPSREDLRSLYLDQLRVAAKSSEADRSGDTTIQLSDSDRAVMSTRITLRINSFANTAHEQEISTRMVWLKQGGDWLISEVQMQDLDEL